MENMRVVANRNICKVMLKGVPDRPGIAAEIFGTLGIKGFNVELVVSTGGTQGRADISLAVDRDQQGEIMKALEPIREELGGIAIDSNPRVTLVSIVGRELSRQPGVAGRMFTALSRGGINIEVISTSMSSVTCMIDESATDRALEALKEEFKAEISGESD